MSSTDRQRMLAEIDRVMTEAGFVQVIDPLTVSGVPFQVLRAYKAGPGFLDLIIVIDALEGTANQLRHGYWLVERIAQALDQSRSPRPLTAIVLHDPAAARVPTEEFLQLGRVLLVTDPDKVEVELAPLLPIVLESSAAIGRDPLDILLSRISAGKDGESKAALINAARSGPDHVQSTFVEWINKSLSEEGGSGVA